MRKFGNTGLEVGKLIDGTAVDIPSLECHFAGERTLVVIGMAGAAVLQASAIRPFAVVEGMAGGGSALRVNTALTWKYILVCSVAVLCAVG